MAFPPPCSPTVILNQPVNIPEGEKANHVFRLWNVPAGPGRFKSPSQRVEPDPSQGPSRISPTPHHIYKGISEAGESVPLPAWTVRPPPILYKPKDSSCEHSLLEAAIAPPCTCIGHYSPPSPSAALIKRAPSPDPASRSPPWPSKGPCCRCLW